MEGINLPHKWSWSLTQSFIARGHDPAVMILQQTFIDLIHGLAILCLIPWIQEVVYLYMFIIVTWLIVSACRGNLAFKCHWILSKLMEIATSIYLFLMSGINFSLELSDYWAFSLVHAACKLQSVVVRITASLLY